jgi:hypothetical protein
MAGAASHVNTQFSTARSYASAAAASANAFITALNSSVSSLVIPPIEPDPTWPETPTTESITPYVVGDVATEFPTDDSGVPPADPGGGFITPDRPTGPTLPTYTLDTAIDPTMPVAPADPTVTMPTEPAAWTPPSEPTLLTIAITPFDGVDTHEEWLDRLDNAPADLSLAAPTPFSYTAPARYSSDLLTAVTEAIRTRLADSHDVASQVLVDFHRHAAADTNAVAVPAMVFAARLPRFSSPSKKKKPSFFAC